MTNFSYDAQSEGSRSVYISRLITHCGQQKKIRRAVLHGLATERNDTWALVQLFDIAAVFAKGGDQEAKKAIYKRLHKKTIKGSEWAGEDAIIAMDGMEGLKIVARNKGRLLAKNPDHWEASWMVDDFQKHNPSIKVYEELEQAGQTDSFIKIYLDAIQKHEQSTIKRERIINTWQTVTDKINKLAIMPLTSMGAKDLTDSDISKLADDFLQESNPVRQELYMRVFSRIKFPYDYQPILQLARGKYSKKDRLVEFSVDALKYFSGKDIRKLADSKLANPKKLEIYTNLLIANYQKGDYKLLTQFVKSAKSQDKIHALVQSYAEIYTANKTKECKKPLEALYNNLTCGIHRADIIRILIENNVLSGKIKKELPFDSYEEIREIFSKMKK